MVLLLNGAKSGYHPGPVPAPGIRTAVDGAAWIGAGANSGFAMLKDGRLMGWGALYSGPMNPGSIYRSALPVEWRKKGWFRPGGYAPDPR